MKVKHFAALAIVGVAAVTLIAFNISRSQQSAQQAVINLGDAEGLKLVKGSWKYKDVPVEELGKAEAMAPRMANFDDSKWETITDISAGRGPGGFSMGWYRIKVVLPEKVGDLEVAGSKVTFETTADDYGEVWVNGNCDFAFGQTGRGAITGFNVANKVQLTANAKPGDTFTIAVLCINGPLAQPIGKYFLRTEPQRPTRLIFEKAAK